MQFLWFIFNVALLVLGVVLLVFLGMVLFKANKALNIYLAKNSDKER